MERELFHSRRLLDTELARQRHIHDFGELARKAKDAKAFCQLAAEHVISTFQLEVSAAYVFAKVSGELDESHAIGITDEVAEDLALTWISTRSKEEPSQSTALIYDGTPQGAVHRNQLVQAIACPCYDSEGDLVALFFGARTKRNAEHTQEIESSLLPSFTMFTEHAGGVVSQLRNLATIAKQIAELRHSKDLLGLAIEGAQIGTWDHNELDGTLRFNEYWARIMGYSYEELVTAYPKWSDVTHPDDFEEAQKAYFAHLRGETELYEAVYRMRHKAGHWVWILDRGQVMKRDADGKALRVCGTHMDISDRKNAEADKLSLQKQVEQSQRLESLGVLAGGVAHDFNNILTVIQANTDLALLVLPQESEALLHLVEIERGARRAAGLAAQMLAFAGRGKFVIETIDLTVLVTEMIQLLRVSISKDIHLEHTSLMGSPSFEGDSSQIRQVVMNLIINASEAIGDRAGDIGITTGVVQCDASYLATFPASLRSATPSAMAPGTYVLLEVNDSGCGMDEEVVQKIFEPFFTTKFTGRGLGMAAVLGILRGHGGALRISLGQRKARSSRSFSPRPHKRKPPDSGLSLKPPSPSPPLK
jgi:PAS domain S-box-containing protein